MEDMPFKLLITSIIMAVVLPLGWAAYSAYDEATLSAYVESRLEALEAAARALSSSPGGLRQFELDLGGSGASDVDWVRLGGPLGSGFDQLVNWSVEGKAARRALSGIRLSSPQNATLSLGAGRYALELESKADWRGSVYVEVRIAGGA